MDHRHIPTLNIRQHDYGDAVVEALVEEVQQEYVVRYGDRDRTPVDPAQFRPPDGLVLVAWHDGEPAGSVAIRRAETSDAAGGPVAEMKRLYVRPAHRRHGLARVLVRAAEDAARSAGYVRLVLETGARQPEAIALYATEGYRPVAAFGVYACAPEARHLGKSLRRSPR